MPTFVMRDGKLVDKRYAVPLHVADAACQVIRDEMDATRHMANGQYYTSKSRFRAATRAAGCVEVGNETKTLLKPRTLVPMDRGARRQAIAHAIQQLKGR